jgi:hypothetical protein
MSVLWISKGTSWRFPLALVIYCLFRFLVQFFIRMYNPTGYEPNLPPAVFLFSNSITKNDFFFSVYIGLPIICACELWKEKNYVMFVICFVSSFYEMVVMIITRGHFIIDLLAGLLFAHYIFLLVDDYIHYIDKSKISIDPNYEDNTEDLTKKQ